MKVGKNKKLEQAADVTCKQKAREPKRCQSGVKCLEVVHQEKTGLTTQERKAPPSYMGPTLV